MEINPYKMIVCNIMGGLGNQMFQIFTALAYGIQHNTKVIFPYSPGTHERPTYWHNFLKNLSVFTTSNPENNALVQETPNIARYNEQVFQYVPFPDFSGHNVLLYGYFQSPKYFEEPANTTILNMIGIHQIRNLIKIEFEGLFQHPNTTTISMHFRLGDYKGKQEYHAILNPDYYISAMKQLLHDLPTETTTQPIRVLYFCEKEDNTYVASVVDSLCAEYSETYNIEFVKVDDRIEDWKQMLLMSCCDHHIIANSTFSWWGAYLGENHARHVYFPSVWFGPMLADKQLHDLCPPGWTRISA